MAQGQWRITTPAPQPSPKASREWPDSDDQGIISVQAGETLAQAIQREGPIAIFKTPLPFACKVTMRLSVHEV